MAVERARSAPLAEQPFGRVRRVVDQRSRRV